MEKQQQSPSAVRGQGMLEWYEALISAALALVQYSSSITFIAQLMGISWGALAGAFHLAPGLLLKFLVWALQVSDYFGCLPGSITHLSHFHGSLYITFMASLGIPPIFHRLYDFGNVPVFWSFGRKRQAFEYQWDGTVARRR